MASLSLHASINVDNSSILQQSQLNIKEKNLDTIVRVRLF